MNKDHGGFNSGIKMKFALVGVKNGCRIGRLAQLGTQAETSLETPMCMLYTKTGSAPHLSRDMLDKIKNIPGIAHVSLPHLTDHYEALAEYKKGIGSFAAMQNYLIYTSVQDPAIAVPEGYNDKTGCAIWGRGGKVKLDVELFMRVQETLRPSFYQALCDSDTNQKSGRKRVTKSVDRTLDFLDKCLEYHKKSEKLEHTDIMGVVEGGYDLGQRKRSAQETAGRQVAGFCIEGFHNYGPDAENFSPRSEEVKHILSETLAALPLEKPRLMHGVWGPDTALEAIELGIDILDSSFPYLVTERGGALIFNYTVPESAEKDEASNANDDEEEDAGILSSRETPFEIDLNNKSYSEDFRPVLPGCRCYTCQKFTRAYINHLLNTSELLAGVLLMIHNFHHYFRFFEAIRTALATDQFAKLKGVILGQKR